MLIFLGGRGPPKLKYVSFEIWFIQNKKQKRKKRAILAQAVLIQVAATTMWLPPRGGGWVGDRERSRSRDRGQGQEQEQGEERAIHDPVLYILGRRETYLEDLEKGRGEKTLYVGRTENLVARLEEHEKGNDRGTREVVKRRRARESRRGHGSTREAIGDTWMVLGLVEGLGPGGRGGLQRARSLEEMVHRRAGSDKQWEGGFWELREHVEGLLRMVMAGGARDWAGWGGVAAPRLGKSVHVRWFLGAEIGKRRRWRVAGVQEVWEEQEAWREQAKWW